MIGGTAAACCDGPMDESIATACCGGTMADGIKGLCVTCWEAAMGVGIRSACGAPLAQSWYGLIAGGVSASLNDATSLIFIR